ncbi:hypothetical protein ABZ897_61780 [Nonomuraea sp. NPDC046802]|uniref:hypothetical protein n=1 Tax=Nonomuraea sp. NPDC046802 TaxID=3154919 RepID=UPI0033C0B3B2
MSAHRRKPSPRVQRNIAAGGAIALTHAIEVLVGQDGMTAFPAVRVLAWRVHAEVSQAPVKNSNPPSEHCIAGRQTAQAAMRIVSTVDGWTDYGNQITWDRAVADIKASCERIRTEIAKWIS